MSQPQAPNPNKKYRTRRGFLNFVKNSIFVVTGGIVGYKISDSYNAAQQAKVEAAPPGEPWVNDRIVVNRAPTNYLWGGRSSANLVSQLFPEITGSDKSGVAGSATTVGGINPPPGEYVPIQTVLDTPLVEPTVFGPMAYSTNRGFFVAWDADITFDAFNGIVLQGNVSPLPLLIDPDEENGNIAAFANSQYAINQPQWPNGSIRTNVFIPYDVVFNPNQPGRPLFVGPTGSFDSSGHYKVENFVNGETLRLAPRTLTGRGGQSVAADGQPRMGFPANTALESAETGVVGKSAFNRWIELTGYNGEIQNGEKIKYGPFKVVAQGYFSLGEYVNELSEANNTNRWVEPEAGVDPKMMVINAQSGAFDIVYLGPDTYEKDGRKFPIAKYDERYLAVVLPGRNANWSIGTDSSIPSNRLVPLLRQDPDNPSIVHPALRPGTKSWQEYLTEGWRQTQINTRTDLQYTRSTGALGVFPARENPNANNDVFPGSETQPDRQSAFTPSGLPGIPQPKPATKTDKIVVTPPVGFDALSLVNIDSGYALNNRSSLPLPSTLNIDTNAPNGLGR